MVRGICEDGTDVAGTEMQCFNKCLRTDGTCWNGAVALNAMF